MIIVCLKGGLGNQMFQYAAGLRLACLHSTSLKLDLSWFNDEKIVVTPRSYGLGHFLIRAEAATCQEIALLNEHQTTRIKRYLSLINPLHRSTHVLEQYVQFDPNILKLPDNIYMDGYWQSEKYFKDIAPEILNEFLVHTAPIGQNRDVASAINDCNAVSIHFRRGDYVTNANIGAKHGTCSVDYYKRAIEVVTKRVERPHFFAFSDDPEWVREHFTVSHAMTLVDHNGPDQAHEDLRLMSFCKHHIIANSSFSWWAAWLSTCLDKIVIAPDRWFNDPSLDTSDLIPCEWFRL